MVLLDMTSCCLVYKRCQFVRSSVCWNKHGERDCPSVRIVTVVEPVQFLVLVFISR
jgi:hypothetical protein